jgi:hypothetical protein
MPAEGHAITPDIAIDTLRLIEYFHGHWLPLRQITEADY